MGDRSILSSSNLRISLLPTLQDKWAGSATLRQLPNPFSMVAPVSPATRIVPNPVRPPRLPAFGEATPIAPTAITIAMTDNVVTATVIRVEGETRTGLTETGGSRERPTPIVPRGAASGASEIESLASITRNSRDRRGGRRKVIGAPMEEKEAPRIEETGRRMSREKSEGRLGWMKMGTTRTTRAVRSG
jgi:hypothetical protein